MFENSGEFMQEKKYEIVGRPIIENLNGRQIETYRIRALKDFTNKSTGIKVKRGEFGGRISLNALSQDGSCWIDEDSVFVSDDQGIKITGDTYVCHSEIKGNILLSDMAVVSWSKLENAKDLYMEIKEQARVVDSEVFGNAKIAGGAQLGKCFVSGQVIIDGQSFLESCVVRNISFDKEKFITIRLFGREQKDYTLLDKKIIDEDFIVNDVDAKKSKKDNPPKLKGFVRIK